MEDNKETVTEDGATCNSNNSGDSDVFEECDVFCQPCGVANKHVQAYGYCRDCGEFLCQDCFTYHTTLTICRHHLLLDKASMPRDKPCEPTIDRCIQRCDIHTDEVVKYYCVDHAHLGCSACMVMEHRKCDDVEYIPAVSKEFSESKHFKDFNDKIVTMMQSAHHIIHVSRDSVTRSARCYSQAIQNVNRLRAEITNALDQLEADVREQTEKLTMEDNTRFNVISGKCEHVLRELGEMADNVKDLQNSQQNCRLYIYLKSSVDSIAKLEGDLKAIENKTSVTYNFQPSKEMENILKTPDKFGKLFKWDFPQTSNANHAADIYVKTKTDKNTCCITGSVMVSEERLVIADRINHKTKLVDINLKKVISEMDLPSSPWDIARLDNDRFAITLPNAKRIVVLKCENDTLAMDSEISVGSECWGIAIAKDKLLVTHENPGSVDILDMSGQVLQRFSTDAEGRELFKRPSYAAATEDLQTIYVADWDANSVTSLSGDGSVQRVYRDGELEYPGKLVVDAHSGVVTVCGINSSNVHLVAADCTRIHVLTSTPGLHHPRTLAYSADNTRLYVGMWENDNIRVYQLS